MRQERGDLVRRLQRQIRQELQDVRRVQARCAKHRAASAGQNQEIGAHLFAIFVRQRLNGGRVSSLHRRLQLRQIRDDARQPHVVVGPGRCVLIHQGAGFRQPALQLVLCSRRCRLIDEIERKTKR